MVPNDGWDKYLQYQKLISSSYILHQPNPWKKRVEVSTPGFELVSTKKTSFSQQNQVFDEAASPQPVEKPSKTFKNSSKPLKTPKMP